jgi:hypothetical protein
MRDVQYTMLVDKGHFTSCFAVYVVLLLVRGPGMLVALGIFTRCFMHAVCCDEAPPPTPGGGGGNELLLTHKIDWEQNGVK